MISNSMLKYPQQIWECPRAPCLKKKLQTFSAAHKFWLESTAGTKRPEWKRSAFPRHIMKLEHRGGVIGKPIKFDHGRSQHVL